MKALLLAEKPSLKRTLESVYNKHKNEIPYDITFMDQRGHLITLKQPDELDEDLKVWSWDTLPIHPEEHGGWQYKIIKEAKVGNYLTAGERFKMIKQELESGQYDFVINAGDPDQEGELLIRIVLASLRNKLPVKRYWCNDTTEKNVLKALNNLLDDDKDPMLVNLLAAAYARQHSDYRFGMNISRASSLKMNGNVACGRVKTPILGLVCKREDEIKNFVPKTCYGVKVNYAEGFSGSLFDVNEADDENDDDTKKKKEDEINEGIIWFDSLKEANHIMYELASQEKALVVKYDSIRKEEYAPALFKLATAQIAAGKLGFTSQQTLDIIQGLYEKGYMSYPRTDCIYISSDEDLEALLKSASSVPELKRYVDNISSQTISKVRNTKKWVNDKKLKEAGHSALTPTTKAPDFDSLSPDEQKIYTLICKQFVAIFLPPIIKDKNLLVTKIGNRYFRSSGSVIIDDGFSKIFNRTFSDTIIPVHEVKDILDIDNFEHTEKTTVCPKRYTDADLTAACESPVKYLNDEHLKSLGKKLVIGTPATRASIIEELINKNKYLQRVTDKKTTYIVPTDIGYQIYSNLKDTLICKVDMTGEWEVKLESIRSGQLSFAEMEKMMMNDVEQMIEDIKNMQMTSIQSENLTVCPCPKCGGEIKTSAKSFYCSNWKEKDCHVGAYNKICDSKLTADEFKDLLAGEQIIKKIKKGTSTWNQKLYYDFNEYKIKFVESEKGSESSKEESTDFICPNCATKLIETNKTIKCPSCEFVLWKVVCGKMLSEKEIQRFFDCGDTGLVHGMKSKSGRIFSAHICLTEDGKKTKFVYEDK